MSGLCFVLGTSHKTEFHFNWYKWSCPWVLIGRLWSFLGVSVAGYAGCYCRKKYRINSTQKLQSLVIFWTPELACSWKVQRGDCALFSAAVLTGAIRNYDNDDTNSGNHNIPQKCTAITFKNSCAKITEVQVRGQFVTYAHIIHKSQQSFHVSGCLRWARVFILVPSKVDTALVSH